MKLLRALPLFIAAFSMVMVPTAEAQSTGDVGLGLYQGAGIRVPRMYVTISSMVAPDFLFEGGLGFSTISTQNFGLMVRGTVDFKESGAANLVLGGSLEVAESGSSTGVAISPIIGVRYELDDEFTISLDALPFSIFTGGGTETVFLEGRLGATWWF